jgi:hypothetical protein
MTGKKIKLNEDGAAAATLATKGLPPNGGAAEVEDGSGNLANALSGLPNADNAGTIKAKGNPMDIHAQSMKEDLAVVFEGSGISEEVVEKTKTLFEAAVNARVGAITKELEETAQTMLDEQVNSLRTELTENVDKYLDYVATEWMTENKVAISNALKLELFGEFQAALKNLFVEHWVEIPEDKMDVLAETVAKAEALETKLNEQIEANIALTSEINKANAAKVFNTVSEGLVLTDVEKFKTLAGDLLEGTSDEQDLKKKLSVIRESHFKVDGKSVKKELNEEVTIITVDQEGKPQVSPSMAAIVEAVNRTIRPI